MLIRCRLSGLTLRHVLRSWPGRPYLVIGLYRCWNIGTLSWLAPVHVRHVRQWPPAGGCVLTGVHALGWALGVSLCGMSRSD